MMKLFSGSSNKSLAEKIAKHLAISVSPVEIFVFPDGERRVRFEESVVGEDVVIVQSTGTPVDQNYMELFFLLDSAKRSGAATITLIMPYFGYQRQDHIFRDGEAVSLQVIIKLLESLAIDRLITVDLHTIRIPELFTIPVTHLSALPLFAQEIKNQRWQDDSVLVSPDMGGINRIKKMAELLYAMPWISLEKNRDTTSGEIAIDTVHPSTNSGQVSTEVLRGKRTIIVDDMISSGNTIVKGAELLKKHGVEEMYVFVTHPVFSHIAPQLLEDSLVKKVFVTDTVAIPHNKRFPKLQILSVASEIAKELKKDITIL